LVRFEFKSGTILMVLTLSLFRVENRVCLSHGVQVAGAVWRTMTGIMAGVGDLARRTVDGRVLGGRTIGRLDDVVCDLHCA
jgi:hypothetical protein